MKKIYFGDNLLFNNEGLFLKNEECEIRVTDFDCKNFGFACYCDKSIIVYEDLNGDIVKANIKEKSLNKEKLLISRTGEKTNKYINAYFKDGDLNVLLSTNYKGRKIIALIKNENYFIFDICDDYNFYTVQRENGNIIVVYTKSGILGCSTILYNGYSDFKKIDTINPIKLFILGDTVYLLSKERDYVLTNLEENIKYILPLVFGAKPRLSAEDGTIYITYRKFRKEVIYMIENEKIIFVSETEI